MTAAVLAPTRSWRCGAAGCRTRPVLAYYTDIGGVYVRVRDQRGFVRRYTYDLRACHVDAHCPDCGEWRRLQIERDTGEITEATRPGFWPAID